MFTVNQLVIDEQEEYKDIGITGFIQKPWTAEELIERIRVLDFGWDRFPGCNSIFLATKTRYPLLYKGLHATEKRSKARESHLANAQPIAERL